MTGFLNRCFGFMNHKKRLLITGIGGLIGQIIYPHLVKKYDIIGIDKKNLNLKNFYKVNISNFRQLSKVFRENPGINYILHLAADKRVNAPWKSVYKNNIVGTINIFQLAVENGVEKIVFASTNHVVGLYENDVSITGNYELNRKRKILKENIPYRPDSYYAISKAVGEVLGKYIAKKYGIRVICIRFGSVLKDDNPLKKKRYMATWLSHRDLVGLIKKSLEYEGKIRFVIVYGVSNNSRRFWSLNNAIKILKFRPKDNAEKVKG